MELDLPSWPAPADLSPLWASRSHQGQAREGLVRHFLPYARMQAAKLYGSRHGDELEFNDYFQFATVALAEAVDGFDPSRDVKFETYAAYRIRGAVLDGIESMSERQRQIATLREVRQARLKSLLRMEPLDGEGVGVGEGQREGSGQARPPAPSEAALFPKDSPLAKLADLGIGLAIGLMLEGTGLVDPGEHAPVGELQMPYARLEMRQRREQLLALVKQLPEQQRLVVQWHYLQGHPFDALVTRLGVSKGRISQLHRAGLATLRRWLEESG